MLRILVCDEAQASQRMATWLDTDGQRVTWESTLARCRAALEVGEHDLFVVGWAHANGLRELLGVAASSGKETRVIAILDEIDPDREAELLRLGVVDVLSRSELGPEPLKRAVRRAAARIARGAPDLGDLMVDFASTGGVIRALRDALSRAARDSTTFAVLSVAVEEFAPRPSPFGDDLERVHADFARTLSDLSGGSDRVYRLGSRFVILLEDLGPTPIAARTADAILERMDASVSLGGYTLQPTVSIGIALSPDDGTEPAQVLKSAKLAMQSAIAAGGRVFRFRTHAPNHQAVRQLALQRGLTGALERGEFRLVYQPQLDLANEWLIGAEALLRWTTSELGPVGPDEFVPLLEQTDRITPVGEWALRQACRQARVWENAGRGICVSVNVSARQFQNSDVEEMVRSALEETGLSPELLGIELTEGLLLESTPEIRQGLESLRQLGVKIAVDDFGTGYASLSYMKRFPMTAIKIDREFVRGLPLDTENAAITSSILALAHSLDLHVIAEGVETEGEQEFLRSLHCDAVQGFLHAQPMSCPDFETWRDAFFGAPVNATALGSKPPPPNGASKSKPPLPNGKSKSKPPLPNGKSKSS